MTTYLLFLSLIGGLFSLAGGFLLLAWPHLAQKFITPLIAFGAGAFLAAAFLDILPEALEASPPQPVLLATLAGFLAFFTLERFVMTYLKKGTPTHTHSDHTEPLGFLLVLGDSLHNFMDGILIALTYVANPALALSTTLAVAAHELPQEIGDFSVLLHLNWKRSKIIGVNILQSLATIPGALLGLLLGQLITPQLPIFLGFTAGIFLYLSASDLVPELHHHSGHKYFLRIILPMLGSIISVLLLTRLAHPS